MAESGLVGIRRTIAGLGLLALVSGALIAGSMGTAAAREPDGSPGSVPVGSADYVIRDNALFVSVKGSDSAAGTLGAPLRTVSAAIDKAMAGQTIILRAGQYHESIIVPPDTPVTIQSYPNEAVWFDGARRVTGFAQSGTEWVVGGWTTNFDSSPTYSKGAPDGTEPGWQWINPDYPMAAHPDQVWMNGTELTQVGTRSAVKPGTFYVDNSASRLYLGDDPTGKTVEASDLQTAMSLRAPGTVIRGLGVRRYANSVWQQGVITSYFPGMTLENVEVRDSATSGIGIYGADCVLRSVTVAGSGQMGIQGEYADNLMVDDVKLVDSNDQRFNPTPSAGGLKITSTRGLTVAKSDFVRTNGTAIWTDHSVYAISIVNNIVRDGRRYGIVLEISSNAVVANNLITNNAYDGILVANTDTVRIWNNTISGNRQAIKMTQDDRRPGQYGVQGADKRRPVPDPTMPWITREVSLGNNILSAGEKDADAVLSARSYEELFTGNEMVSSSNGNVFHQAEAGSPGSVVIWGRKSIGPISFGRLGDYVAATGRDKNSISVVGTPVVTSGFQTTTAVDDKTQSVAQPLPTAIAARVGQDAGTEHLGAWR